MKITMRQLTRPTRNELILDAIRKGTRSKSWSGGNRPNDARADRRAAKRDLRKEW